MSEFVTVNAVINHAIETEDQAAAAYKNFARKLEALKPEMFYTRHQNKISWNEDLGFYKQLEEAVMGTNAGSYFYSALPPKIEKSDSVYFYKNLGDKFTDDVSAVFLSMAKEEEAHAETFRKLLDTGGAGGFGKEIANYITEHSDEVAIMQITAPNTILHALEQAVLSEQRAVNYYNGMLPYASPVARGILEKIINEERCHEAKLKAQIKSYKLLLESL